MRYLTTSERKFLRGRVRFHPTVVRLSVNTHHHRLPQGKQPGKHSTTVIILSEILTIPTFEDKLFSNNHLICINWIIIAFLNKITNRV